jgi:hypothetical protein
MCCEYPWSTSPPKVKQRESKNPRKGEAFKYDRNFLPNGFSVGLIMPFIDPNISQGKVNVTINCRSGARPVFEKHKSPSQNRRRKEEEEANKIAAATLKDKIFSAHEKEGRELIEANKTRRVQVLLDGKKKKNKCKSLEQFLFETENRVNIEE